MPGARGQLLDLTEHQLDDPFLRPRSDVDDADGLAFAKHGRTVADRCDLDHAMRDEDDGPIAAALATDDLEHTLGQVRRQRRGDLVEQEHVGLDRQRARQIDDAQRGQRNVAAPWSRG